MDRQTLLENLKPFCSWNGRERCGIILESGEVVELENESSANDEFCFNHEHLRREDIWATWHSHPRGLYNLSAADLNSFLTQPRLRHFVVTDSSVVCYKIYNETFVVIDHDYTSLERVLGRNYS